MKLIHASAYDGMDIIDPASVNLVCTSPPYGVNMDYDQKDIDPQHYWTFTTEWLQAVHRILKPDGYVAVNIPVGTNSFGTSFVPTFYGIAREIGFHDTGVLITWVKRFDDSGRLYRKRIKHKVWNGRLKFQYCAEMVLVVSGPEATHRTVGQDLTEGERYAWAFNVWDIQPETDRTHPAPYPIELPTRIIKIFSNPHDTVLDPFVGSGTTLLACHNTGREGIGIDHSENYLRMAHKRLSDVSCEWHIVDHKGYKEDV